MAGCRAGTQPWRRLFHAVNGVLLGTAIHYLPLASLTVAAILGGVFSVLLLADVVRLTQPRANELFFRVFGPLASPREARGLASSTWYTLGVALAVALFPRGAAVSAVLVLGLCDPGASYVGRRWGRRPLLGGTLEGSAVFVCVAALVLVLRHPLPAALPAALIAALAELLSWPLDDNFTIPIACAAALTSLEALG
jgi:dolichol kinase